MRSRFVLVAGCALIGFVLATVFLRGDSSPPAEGPGENQEAELGSPDEDRYIQPQVVRHPVVPDTPSQPDSSGQSSDAQGGGVDGPPQDDRGATQSLASMLRPSTEPDAPIAKSEKLSITSPEQMRDFVEQAVSSLEMQIPELSREIANQQRSRLKGRPSQRAEDLIVSLADHELSYRYELYSAVRQEFSNQGAVTPIRPTKESPGASGNISLAVAKSSIWPRAGTVDAGYIISYSKYTRVGAANQARATARREWESFLSGLETKPQ